MKKMKQLHIDMAQYNVDSAIWQKLMIMFTNNVSQQRKEEIPTTRCKK
jgi:hypothetical protein